MSRRHAHPKRHATRQNAPARRSLHLIDVDNLVRDPRTLDRRQIEDVLARYRQAAEYREGDHSVVATGKNGRHVLETELAWATASHRRRSGHDGADLMLLEEVDWAIRGRRYGRVVIGSGDHIFAAAARRLMSVGITVAIVAPLGAASSALVVASGLNIRYLSEGDPSSRR